MHILNLKYGYDLCLPKVNLYPTRGLLHIQRSKSNIFSYVARHVNYPIKLTSLKMIVSLHFIQWNVTALHKANEKSHITYSCDSVIHNIATYLSCFSLRAQGVQIRWPQGNCRGPFSKYVHIAHCNRSSLAWIGSAGKLDGKAFTNESLDI